MLVDFSEKLEVPLLGFSSELRLGIEIGDARFVGAHCSALVDGREPALSPVRNTKNGKTSRIFERHVSREVICFGAERVCDPASKGGSSCKDVTRLHRVDALAVVTNTRLHAAQQGYLIDDLREVGKQLADGDTALTVLLELPGTREKFGARVAGIVVLDIADKVLAVAFVEFWLRIKEIDLAWTALHEHGDHRLGLRLDCGRLGDIVEMPLLEINRFC